MGEVADAVPGMSKSLLLCTEICSQLPQACGAMQGEWLLLTSLNRKQNSCIDICLVERDMAAVLKAKLRKTMLGQKSYGMPCSAVSTRARLG